MLPTECGANIGEVYDIITKLFRFFLKKTAGGSGPNLGFRPFKCVSAPIRSAEAPFTAVAALQMSPPPFRVLSGVFKACIGVLWVCGPSTFRVPVIAIWRHRRSGAPVIPAAAGSG